MAKNKIQDLRNHLFETIEMLKDNDEEDTGMTIQKANAISKVAQTIINSAKLEIDFMKTCGTMDGTQKPSTDFLLGTSEEKKK